MTWPRRPLVVAVVAAIFAGPAWPAAAQETRVEAITTEQAEKAKTVKPYEIGTWEHIAEKVETGEWLNPSNTHGFFPTFETVYSGGGLTLGGGWRFFTGHASFVDVRGLYSVKHYKMGEARVRFPKNFGGRFDTGFRVGWRDATQIGFYGLGNDTSEDDRANFRIQQAYAEAGVELRPVPWMFLEAAAGYDDFEEDSGLGSDPGIEEVYDSTTAPGLFNDPTYVRARGAAGFNWLKNPGYSRKGGFLRVNHDHFFPIEGTGGGDFGIGRVELVQHLPIARETWVLSLRARGETVVSNVADTPYFLLPWLGSGDTLRGYPTGRFRDRSTMLYSAEWRWFPNRRAFDVAVFADAGQVAEDVDHLEFKNLTTDYGIGFRFHIPTRTLLRLDFARGHEGWRLVFSTGSPF
jgi:hypothetical protein